MNRRFHTIGILTSPLVAFLIVAAGCQVHVSIGPAGSRQNSVVDARKVGDNATQANDDSQILKRSDQLPSKKQQANRKVALWKKTFARRGVKKRTQANAQASTSKASRSTKTATKKTSERSMPNDSEWADDFESPIQITDHQLFDGQIEPIELVAAPQFLVSSEESQDGLLPQTNASADDQFPIDLATALQLAGANNVQIALAGERVEEAQARLDQADVLWVPSVKAGVGYNKHDGRLQATEGIVQEVSRNSLFVGGGLGLSGAPLTGASSGPARLFVDLSPVDIYFEPLAARQSREAAQFGETVTFNDTLLEVTMAYLELVRSQSKVVIAEEAIKNAKELVNLTENFSRTGAGLEADAARARAELANRRREKLAAQERVQVVSTELARLLRLNQNVVLFAAESQPAPLEIVSDETSLEKLVAQALTNRPELCQYQALVAATLHRMQQEKWRPWIPNVHLGASGGGFGGGQGSFNGNFSGRSDFDALAVWELRNLGLGNRSVQRERSSQHRQAHLAYTQVEDQIVAEVTRAYQQVQSRKGQIEQAKIQVRSAATALPLNFNGIRGRELRAIEAQQAIAALAMARDRYLSSVIDYDRAQFALLRAIGRPPESPVDDSSIEDDRFIPPVPAHSDAE